MKKSALRKLIRETIREQVGGTQGACIDPCANNYNTSAGLITCNGIDFSSYNSAIEGDSFYSWFHWGPESGTPEWINANCIPPYEGFNGGPPPIPTNNYFDCCTYNDGVRGNWDPKPTLNTFGQPVSTERPGKPQVSNFRPPLNPPTSPANRPPKPPTSPANKTPKKLR